MGAGPGTFGGAASGAASGAAIGGPAGAIIGAVVGGIGGYFSDRASVYARQAARLRERVGLISNFLQRRAMIQNYALQRSQIQALGLAAGAGIESSGIQGTMQSLQAQTESNLDRNAEQVILERKANKYTRKAGKYSQIGSAIGGIVEAAGQSGLNFGGGGSGYSAASQRAGTGGYQYGTISSSMGVPPPIYSGGFGSPPITPPPTTINTSPFG